MIALTATFLAGLLTGALIAVLYYELRNQDHMWKDACATPAETQSDIRFVAAAMADALDAEGVTWWLDYGTLLGAWRIGDCLPYDHDLDMSYLARDLERLKRAAVRVGEVGIEVRVENGALYYRGRKIGDIEAWHEYRGRLCRENPAGRSGIMRLWRPLVDDVRIGWVTPTRRIRFAGRWYRCPARTETLLRHRYLMCRIHLRFTVPHKVRCWICAEFWRWAYRIWTCRTAPVIEDGGDRRM